METLHLVLRRFTESDFQDFSELIRDKQESKYAIYDDQFPTDEDDLKNVLLYFVGTDEFFAVELKSETMKVIILLSLLRILLNVYYEYSYNTIILKNRGKPESQSGKHFVGYKNMLKKHFVIKCLFSMFCLIA